MTAEPTPVDFWFDPVCPWAWITSRWLLEVTDVRPVRPRWHVMSLTMLNEQREMSEEQRVGLELARGPARVCAAAAAERGEEALGPLYTELGRRGHVAGRGFGADVVEEALAAAGLPAALGAAARSDAIDADLRRSHEAAMQRVGTDVGTPVITVGDRSIFGPVVTPAPRGEAAGRLWDGLLLVLGTDGFFELKKTRDARPAFD